MPRACSLALCAFAAALAAAPPASAQTGGCETGETALCLQGDRFRIGVDWSDPHNGGSGVGRTVPITSDTGAFWFFRDSNLELIVKVLDGRPLNGRFWVFWSALTDVGYTITVDDTVTGLGRRYDNPPFVVGHATDTDAVDPRLVTGSLMWIGAHPDDEAIVAPLLGQACVEAGRPCTLLVATRGEAGTCRLPGGCLPDLATVRTAEMAAAADLFGAALVQWQLPDGSAPTPQGVRAAWAAADGGEAVLLDRLADAIHAAAPDVVLTWDPRHGSTCHPDHRALGALVLDALARLGPDAPAAWLVEAIPHTAPAGEPAGFTPAVPADDRVTSYDATRPLASVGDQAWRYVVLDVSAHPSQFTADVVAALAAAPADRRRDYALAAASSPDPRYELVCTP